jgi:hypothetical protein
MQSKSGADWEARAGECTDYGACCAKLSKWGGHITPSHWCSEERDTTTLKSTHKATTGLNEIAREIAEFNVFYRVWVRTVKTI